MNMSASNLELLKHISEETNFIPSTTQGKNQTEVADNPVLTRAIIRSLKIIGEAAKKIDDEFRAGYLHIE